MPATAGTHAELLVWSTIDTSYQLINVKNAGHWQPQPVQAIPTASAVCNLDSISILVLGWSAASNDEKSEVTFRSSLLL